MKRVLLLHMWSEHPESITVAFSSSESVLVCFFSTVRECKDTFAKASASQKPGPAGLVPIICSIVYGMLAPFKLSFCLSPLLANSIVC